MLRELKRYSTGNSMMVYNDSAEAYEKMWAAVDAAKKSVKWQTYNLKNDAVGQKTVEKLVAARKRGCHVELLYDDGGNITGRTSLVGELRDCGATVVCYKPFFSCVVRYFKRKMSWRHSPAIRNHRKILIVDDEIGFAGGLNVGAPYAGKRVGGDGTFRDSHCKITGPAVQHLLEVYEDTLAELNARPAVPNRFSWWRQWAASRMRNSVSKFDVRRAFHRTRSGKIVPTTAAAPAKTNSNSSFVENSSFDISQITLLQEFDTNEPVIQILMCNPHVRDWTIQRAMWIVVRKAVKSVYITTPYFLPTRKLLRAVIYAARRGVDVRIIAGGKTTTDPPFMWWVSQCIFDQLLKAGVKFYEFQERSVHAKTVIVDGVWCSVGSYNWDVLSNKLLEVCISTLDPATAHAVTAHFEEDMSKSTLVTREEFAKRSTIMRWICSIAYFILRLVERLTFWDYNDPELTSGLE